MNRAFFIAQNSHIGIKYQKMIIVRGLKAVDLLGLTERLFSLILSILPQKEYVSICRW